MEGGQIDNCSPAYLPIAATQTQIDAGSRVQPGSDASRELVGGSRSRRNRIPQDRMGLGSLVPATRDDPDGQRVSVVRWMLRTELEVANVGSS